MILPAAGGKSSLKKESELHVQHSSMRKLRLEKVKGPVKDRAGKGQSWIHVPRRCPSLSAGLHFVQPVFSTVFLGASQKQIVHVFIHQLSAQRFYKYVLSADHLPCMLLYW